MTGEYFSLGAGTDIAPFLKGLEDDLCQSPHWGYLIEGEVTVDYKDGQREVLSAGDLFHWPPAHTVRVGKDAEIILFSPDSAFARWLNNSAASWKADADHLQRGRSLCGVLH